MLIDFQLEVLCEPTPNSETFAERLEQSPFVVVMLTRRGFKVRVVSTYRPTDDVHLRDGFEAARALAMLTDGTLLDPLTGLRLDADSLRGLDWTSTDAHVRFMVDTEGSGATFVRTLGMGKYGLAEVHLALGHVSMGKAVAALHLLEAAASGMVCGVYPTDGRFELLGDIWRARLDDGHIALEPVSISIPTLLGVERPTVRPGRLVA